ncbi:MAG TPA: FlgD immunoglobulin-like domain containing protein [Armatimonadota bacterium]|jgi:hypothetical protein
MLAVAGTTAVVTSGALGGARVRPLAVKNRPVITTKLPDFQASVSLAQGSGPSPDANLNADTPVSNELDPFAWNNGTTDRIAFVSNGVDADHDLRIDPTFPADPNFTPHYNIWIMRPDGSEQLQITTQAGGDIREPAYDASRNLFAYTSNISGTWQIYTLEIASGVVRQITIGPGNKRHPSWSPDENYLVFSSDAGGQPDIYKIRSDGAGAPIKLTNGPGANTSPNWKPASNLIAYTAQIGAVTRIFTVDDQGTVTNQISDGGGVAGASDMQPTWQSNGQSLAFASNRKIDVTDSTSNFNIWKMPAVGEVGNPTISTLVSDAADGDTFNNTYPTISTPMSRQEMRVIYQSDKTSPAHNNFDLYSRLIVDVLAPRLLTIPTVDNRLPVPGGSVTVSVPIFDPGTGVKQVTAFFRDPDRKIYRLSNPASFDPGFLDGFRYLEFDSQTVGSTVMDDPGGTGTFTGTFVTSANAHDYIIDIQTTDNAGNTLRYDNVFGFSTRIFTPTSRMLFVDDYCEGQKFIGQLGSNNDSPAGYPVESYYRSNPGYSPVAQSTVDFDSIAGAFGVSYDTWRVICRGRIPATVYLIYKPTFEFQLDPATAVSDPVNAKATRKVVVSEHMIVWGAPHTGDVWVPSDSGSIVDATVQGDLANYMNNGGKLFLSGQDIAWALTLNGTTPNSFLANTLHATFVTDSVLGAPGSYGFTVASQAGDPVASAMWSPWFDAGEAPINIETPRITNNFADGWKQDAADNSFMPDVINVASPAVKLYGYNGNGAFNFAGPSAGLRFQDATTGAQLVYLAFGFEQLHRGYHQPSGTPPHCQNFRAHLLTNSYIWMTTGTFQGRVLGIDGKPINNPNPIVRLLQGGVVYAVRVQDDGTYVINGVAPGGYSMEAFRPGYQIDHFESNLTHAALGPIVQDFALTKSTPGAIAGVVTSKATGKFLSNVPITIYFAVPASPPLPPTDFVRGAQAGTATSAADGTYSVGGLEPGKYFVVADGSAQGYSTDEQLVDVVTGNSTTANFALTAAPGSVTVTVIRGDTSTPLVGATVQIMQGAVVLKTGVTAAGGKVTLELVPGTYAAQATAAGFGVSTAVGFTVESQQNTLVTLQLSPEPPGTLSGRITSATTGQPVGGVTVHLQVNGVDVTPSVKSSASFTTPPVGDPYNYRFTSAPTGQVTVVPEAPGFTVTPASRTATVTTGQETPGINFQLSSLHTFPTGLSLFSTPYNYDYKLQGGVDVNDPARLLGMAPGSLMMATFLPTANRYALYPNAPADHFRLGVGYWLNLPAQADLSRLGTAASDPFPIPLQPGFNLIGDPFLRSIDFNSVLVRDSNNVTMTLQQAVTSNPPKLQGTLFAYVLGGYRTVSVLSPWVGYWLRASEPLTLLVSQATGGLAVDQPVADTPAARWGVPVPASGWLMPLVVSSGNCADQSTFLGVSPQGATTYDDGRDLAKPPTVDYQPYVYAGLVKDRAPGPLAVDLRSAAGEQVWTVSVKTNLVGSTVTVRWPDLTLLPNNARPVLEDIATGQRVYMRTTGAYSFTAGAQERLLRVILTPDSGSGAVVSALSTAASEGRVGVIYTLSTSAAVTVEIRNISGVLVRQLATQTPQAAGVQTLSWNGRNQSGASAPAGRYLVTVRAVTPEGRAAQALASVWLNR